MIALSFSVSAIAQFPQMKRAQERREQSLRAEEEREKAEKAKNGNQPAAKSAVMNVDVQMTSGLRSLRL